MTDAIKTNILFKNYKGWGSTHYKRETFEELFRSYNTIDVNGVLTYGNLIPRKEGDQFFNQIPSLQVGDVLTYKESSYNTVPLIKKCEVTLTPISPNCKEVFAILDEEGNQIKDIIPYDYSLDGIYQYKLRTANYEEIPFGVGEWDVDINSSLLVFHKYTPEGVDPDNPPTLTFFRYVGPKGERTYIDASLLDVPATVNGPVTKITDKVLDALQLIDTDWFDKYGFNGSDKTQGIGLQYNLTTPVVDSLSKDSIKGWDADSNAQVVSLLSRKIADNVLFVSNTLENGEYTIQVEQSGISKIDLEGGFVVFNGEPGTYTINVEDSEDIYCVLLVKKNDTNAFDLYIPREELSLDIKLPVFVDLKILPPHLKLNTLASYSDDITPQYYGPRTKDFVIASPETVNSKSSDFIVYNREDSLLSDALDAMEGSHLYLRNGNYLNSLLDTKLNLTLEDKVVSGESKTGVAIKHAFIYLKGLSILENLTLEDCEICVEDADAIAEIKNCKLEKVTVKSGTLTLIDTIISDKLDIEEGATVEIFNSIINEFNNTGAKVLSKGNYINTLNWEACDPGSILDTTTIGLVNALPDSIKLDSTYITSYGPDIDTTLYPNVATIPYYKDFEHRVFAKLPDPFLYDPEKNEITIKLDTILNTIKLNENGELATRTFYSNEIEMSGTPETQIEAVYGQHADTKLDHDKPRNVDEALLDLYWSKADLKGGKIPIDQLPDSIAGGGLVPVGMWSFEDHVNSRGVSRYPTFQDIDFRFMSDDSYTDLQRGWFFIVKESHKEDDPCYPQIAPDGEVYTAGDWIVYGGRNRELVVDSITKQALNRMDVIDEEKNTYLQFAKDFGKTAVFSSMQQYYGGKKYTDLSTLAFFKDHVDLYKSNNNFHFVESFPVKYVYELITYEGVKPYNTVTEIHIGPYKFKVNGTAVKSKDGGTAVNNVDTQFLTADDYLTGKSGTTGRLLLEALDEESKAWAEEVFITTPGNEWKFSLRPTMLDGWYGDTHADFDVALDNIPDEVYSIETNWYGPVRNSEQLEKWQKIDRAYLDPVYSRLPEKAPNSEGVNPEWSILDGGTGLLRLSYKSLAEALRLINEELFHQYPQAPNSIKTFHIDVDERTTAKQVKFIPLRNNTALDSFKREAIRSTCWDKDSGLIYLKTVGKTDLPLESWFYTNDERSLKVLNKGDDVLYNSISGNIISSELVTNLEVKTIRPYKEFNLGFKNGEVYQASQAVIEFDPSKISGFKEDFEILLSQYELAEEDYIENIDLYIGNTFDYKFTVREFYNLEELDIQYCNTVNVQGLNREMETHRVAGIPALIEPFKLTGDFNIINFAKFDQIYENSDIDLKAYFGDKEIPVNATRKQLVKQDGEEGAWTLEVGFETWLVNDYTGQRDLSIICSVIGGENVSIYEEVLNLKKILTVKEGELESVKNNPESLFFVEKAAVNRAYNFETTYNTNGDLILSGKGWGWPTEEEDFVNSYNGDTSANFIPIDFNSGVVYNEKVYRFLTKKFELENIYDLTGFMLKIDWNKVPEIVSNTGALKDVVVQVCVSSEEAVHELFMDGNKPAPIMFVCGFNENEAVLYPGKSFINENTTVRRITFGRQPVPVKEIFIRIGLPKDCDNYIKGINLDID